MPFGTAAIMAIVHSLPVTENSSIEVCHVSLAKTVGS